MYTSHCPILDNLNLVQNVPNNLNLVQNVPNNLNLVQNVLKYLTPKPVYIQ